MTLLVTVFAAIACTVIWYRSGEARQLKIGTLCLMYWGASLMWFVDAIFEYAELGAESFVPAPLDMLNDLYLGLSVVALGLLIWLAVLFVRDPKGVVRAVLLKKAA
jgi:hypothetical protein